MKLLLFLVLLFANLLFGYFQYMKSRADSEASAQIALLQINPDKIKLVKPGTQLSRPSLTCLEWGSFSAEDTARASAALSKLQLGDRFTERDNDPGYWVYIAPLKNKAEAEKKVNELKARGVTDFYIVQDEGQWQFAVSLGAFKTEEAAANYLAQLRQKNVRSALVGPRGAKTSIFAIRDSDNTVTTKLGAIKTDFPNAQLKVVACNEALPAVGKSN